MRVACFDPDLTDAVVAAIYTGTLNDEPWQLALDMLRKALDSEYGTLRLVSHNPAVVREAFIAPPGNPPEVAATFLRDLSAEFIPANLHIGAAVITEWDPSELRGAGLEHKLKYGIDMSLSVCVAAEERSRCILQFTRSKAHGRYSAADLEFAQRIGAHFGRAIGLRRIAINTMVTSEFQADALNKFGIGGVLVAPDRTIHVLNRAAETLIAQADGIKLINGRLVATDSADDTKLQRAISNALSRDVKENESYGLSVQRRGSARALGVVINSRPYRPLLSSATQRCALVFLRNPEFLTLADTKLMRQLFGFTPAEAKLAIYLTSGKQLEDIESILNICHNTARAHLRSMYQKANVNSQAELIQLLTSCAAPLGREEEVTSGQSH
jgi:DNA-binding CsgD family transcriptional regulator